SKSIEMNCGIDKAWQVMTEPDYIKEYLYGTQTATDWKVGSDIKFQGEYQGQQYFDKGVVLTNTPKEELSYSYWSSFSGLEDKTENYSQITYLLKMIDPKKTELTWSQKGYQDEEQRLNAQNQLGDFLETIKVVAER
ncbi:MAG: SRPBCC domain-containing protein, partial [Vallitaleaceae bacterium]|nr:SRPBCC domain-containing protein [Vallitaleaceae bacterium]